MEQLCGIPLVSKVEPQPSSGAMRGAGAQVAPDKLWDKNMLYFYIKNSEELKTHDLNKSKIVSLTKKWNPTSHGSIPELLWTDCEEEADIRIQIS